MGKVMKKTVAQAVVRRVDEALEIAALFDGRDFAFDFVIGSLHGAHPKTINRVSDRVYYVLEGNGHATVGDEVHEIDAGSLIVIPAGTPHGISGDLRYIIITAPPFAPENEERPPQ
jgi:mannose-6-phosphate isomerase-like protein (cupin superfamily)